MIDVQPLTVRDRAWAVQVEAESWGSLPLLRARESSLTSYTDTELAKLWPQMEMLDYDPVYITIARAAVATGARLGELVALDWDDLRLGERELEIGRHYDATDGMIGLGPVSSDHGARTNWTVLTRRLAEPVMLLIWATARMRRRLSQALLARFAGMICPVGGVFAGAHLFGRFGSCPVRSWCVPGAYLESECVAQTAQADTR
jgi:integrase